MSITTYQFAHNNPVWKIEIEGLEGEPANGKKDVINHEPIKVKNTTVQGFVGGGLVETKVVQETTKKAVESTGSKIASGLGRAAGTVLALLTDYMSPNFGGKTDEGSWPSVKGSKIDEKFSLKDYKIKEKTIEDTPIKRLNDKLKILNDASIPGDKTKGKTTQYEREGGLDEANKVFDGLLPENVKNIGDNGRTGTLPDGSTINIYPVSSGGKPTVEIIHPNNRRTKYRFNE